MAKTTEGTDLESTTVNGTVNAAGNTDAGATAAAPSEKLELTERELAIARGEDPDNIKPASQQPSDEAASQDQPQVAPTSSQPNAPASQTPATSQTTNSWITDDVKLAAGTLGLTDADLQEFKSTDEFLRFGRLMSRRQAGQQTGQQPAGRTSQHASQQPTQPAAEQTAQQSTQQPASQQTQSAGQSLNLVDPEWYRKNGYDEHTIAMAQALRETQETLSGMMPLKTEFEQQKQQLALQQQNYERQQQESEARRFQDELVAFHQVADGLESKLFGKQFNDDGDPVQIDAAFNENRRALWEAYKTLEAGIVERAVRAGQSPTLPNQKQLVLRAQQMVFASQLDSIRAQERVAAAKTQSGTRRQVAAGGAWQGGAASGSTAARGPKNDSDEDQVKRIASDPEVSAFWNRTQQENGAR